MWQRFQTERWEKFLLAQIKDSIKWVTFWEIMDRKLYYFMYHHWQYLYLNQWVLCSNSGMSEALLWNKILPSLGSIVNFQEFCHLFFKLLILWNQLQWEHLRLYSPIWEPVVKHLFALKVIKWFYSGHWHLLILKGSWMSHGIFLGLDIFSH